MGSRAAGVDSRRQSAEVDRRRQSAEVDRRRQSAEGDSHHPAAVELRTAAPRAEAVSPLAFGKPF